MKKEMSEAEVKWGHCNIENLTDVAIQLRTDLGKHKPEHGIPKLRDDLIDCIAKLEKRKKKAGITDEDKDAAFRKEWAKGLEAD